MRFLPTISEIVTRTGEILAIAVVYVVVLESLIGFLSQAASPVAFIILLPGAAYLFFWVVRTYVRHWLVRP